MGRGRVAQRPRKPTPGTARSRRRRRREGSWEVDGGQGGIRTLVRSHETHFPGVRLRPLGHLSAGELRGPLCKHAAGVEHRTAGDPDDQII